jgi:hypothetical protein
MGTSYAQDAVKDKFIDMIAKNFDEDEIHTLIHKLKDLIK